MHELKPLVTVRQKNNCPVMYVWVNGDEVARVEFTPREAINLIKDLAGKLEIHGTYRT